MLKKIRLKGCFTHQDRTFEFKEGLTAITGLNGTGKSLIQEMIQFAFWGINALRGISDDYKELFVELECEIKGKPYTIHRTTSKATLFEGYDIEDTKTPTKLASGTKAVNQAVRELFGYSMAVFQVANAINQKEVDKFCQMLPTARKKLVDETIGLSALDTLVKWVSEQELGLRAQVTAHAGFLVEPVEPVLPEGYSPSADISKALTDLHDLRRQRDVLTAKASEIVEIPALIELEYDDALLDNYCDQQRAYEQLVTEAVLLGKEIASTPVLVEVKHIELEKDDARLEEYRELHEKCVALSTSIGLYEKTISRIPLPEYTLEQLDAFDAQTLLLERWTKRQYLMEKGVAYHCGECGHEGHMHDPRVESEYGDVPEQRPYPALVKDTAPHRRVLEQQEARLRAEAELSKLQKQYDEACASQPTARILAIMAAREALAANANALRNKERYAALQSKREDLNARLAATPARREDIARIEKTRTARFHRETTMVQVMKRVNEIQFAKEKLKTFSTALDNEIETAEKIKQESIVYETNLQRYQEAKVNYETELAKHKIWEDELEDWAKGKQSISDLRTRVKGFLLPSLNKVASYLLHEFTGGVMQWLVINDNFEVIVDGKRVETLSGGGKTVVNLAIRIGLGQVLTNQVFPVLMADEPDESCDEQRASYIEKTFNVLKQKMKQIILVTHKTGGTADNHITL